MLKPFKWKLIAYLILINCVEDLTKAEKVQFENYHIYQLQPKTLKQLSTVKNLVAEVEYVFLNAVNSPNSNIIVLVPTNKLKDFLWILHENNIFYTAQSDLAAELKQRDYYTYNWNQYHKLNDTYNWLYSLARQFPNECSVFEAGRTYENRKMLGLKISYYNGNGTKNGIFLEAGTHAREWIGPATATYIIWQLLTSTNEKVRMIAENFDWYIVPHTNPDGYVYTHTTDRLWRKSRTPYKNGCYGADLNRNWNFHWNEIERNESYCSETYPGPFAFSEVETKTLSNFIRTLKDKLLLYVSFHSYSQMLLFPYGYTNQLPPDYANLKRVLKVSIKALKQRYGTVYEGGSIYRGMYPASGCSLDWIYGLKLAHFVFGYELRPSKNGSLRFQLPASQIIPTAEETLDSITAMINEIALLRNLTLK